MTNDTTRAMLTAQELEALANALTRSPNCKEAQVNACRALRAIADQMRKSELVADNLGCLMISDWALSQAYREAVGALDPSFKNPTVLVWASNITVRADRLDTEWKNKIKDYMKDPRALAEWMRIHWRSGWNDLHHRVPEILAIYETLLHNTNPLADAEDARRYRWLCNQGIDGGLFIASGSTGTWGECGHSDWVGLKNLLDQRIDSAMKEDSHE